MTTIKLKPNGKLSIDIALSAVWCIFVLVVTGCNFALMNPLRIVLLIVGFALTAFYIYKYSGKDKEAKIMAVVTIAAIAVRTLYVLYTGAEQRQHDLGEFETFHGYAYHSEYIEYLLNNHKLLDEDITQHWQFYHPPFSHAVSALFFAIYRKLAPASYAHNWDALQCLSLFYSLVTLAVLKKFIELWNLTPKGKTIAYITVALLPEFIVFSGSLNNDPLAITLAISAFYLAWVWYNDEKKSFLKLMGISLCIGFGMMAKISAGLIAFPIGFMMLKAFFESKKKLKMVWQYLVFLAVCAPLGLWYQVRNYIKWQVPLTYVARPDIEASPRQLIAPMPFWRRFLAFEEGVDYNIITETLNQACFDDEYYREHMILAMIGYLLLTAFTVFTITILINFIVNWVKDRDMMNLVMSILLISQLISYVYFCYSYAYTCTMEYRYIVLTCIPAAYYSGKAMKNGPNLLSLFTKVFVYAVAVTSFALYCLAWMLDVQLF